MRFRKDRGANIWVGLRCVHCDTEHTLHYEGTELEGAGVLMVYRCRWCGTDQGYLIVVAARTMYRRFFARPTAHGRRDTFETTEGWMS